MEISKQPERWIAYRHPNPQACIRLLCFPYAGGSASLFRTWFKHLPAQVEVCPVQIPGREARLTETSYKRLDLLIDALTEALLPVLDKPFALFGHSMGALISFELARWLRRAGLPQPTHLFLSGARPPQLPDPDPPIHQLLEKEFIEAIRRFNGTPEEVLQHEELMQILLPYLRADFELYETYTYQPEAPLSVPITVFGGWQDKKASPQQLEGWRDQTLNTCIVRMFPGDHFFLHSSLEQVLLNLSDELKQISC